MPQEPGGERRSSAQDLRPASRWPNRLAVAGLAATVGWAYMCRLYPGLAAGDSAELQAVCPLLGVCHPPGYALEVVAGKLFSLLPIGPNLAWRINFMQAVSGVVGCLALYAALRRLTGQILPALIGAATLAFSVIYWLHATVAEVYVFHAMFLLLAMYAAVRFLHSDRFGWLLLTALLLGICIGGRPPELLVLPGFVGLALGYRRQVRLRPVRLLTCLPVALLPFVFSVGFVLVRQDPRSPHARDDALRDEILGLAVPAERQAPAQRISAALRYCLGLEAAGGEDFTVFSWQRLAWDLNKYAWLLSGWGARGWRFSEAEIRADPLVEFRAAEQGRGTSIGALGVLLAVIGVSRWRRQYPAVLLGLGLFLGNLVYYLYVHPKDNLDFTIPGTIGLATLVGLGTSARPDGRAGGRVPGYQLACLAVPAFLLATNWRFIEPLPREAQQPWELADAVKQAPLPERAVIVATYWRAHTLRYLYWVEAGRRDVHVLIHRERFRGTELYRLVSELRRRGHTVLLSTEAIRNDQRRRLLASWTPRELVAAGFFRAYPPDPLPAPGAGR